MKQPFTFNQFITMIPSHEIIGVFISICRGENGIGSQRRRKEREREWINGVREGALVINGNGMCQKWLLVNLNTRVILSMQINRTNKLSMKLSGSQIQQFCWCHNICSHDYMFCALCHWGSAKENSVSFNSSVRLG